MNKIVRLCLFCLVLTGLAASCASERGVPHPRYYRPGHHYR